MKYRQAAANSIFSGPGLFLYLECLNTFTKVHTSRGMSLLSDKLDFLLQNDIQEVGVVKPKEKPIKLLCKLIQRSLLFSLCSSALLFFPQFHFPFQLCEVTPSKSMSFNVQNALSDLVSHGFKLGYALTILLGITFSTQVTEAFK